jgi:hypothetical protein
MKRKSILGVLLTIMVTFCFLLAGCKDSGGDDSTTGGGTVVTFTSVDDFETWLDSQPDNNAENPYTVKLNVSDLGDYSDAGSVRVLLLNNDTKYVNLDLSGSTITSIGGGAFQYCTSLTGITIPNSVTEIGGSAFLGCESLTSVTIPASVTSMGYAFNGCYLTAINVDAGNTEYSSQDGVLYNKAKTTLIKYPQGKTGAFTIPPGVTSIGELAFYECYSLDSVTIPASVTSIGEYAFDRCNMLYSVTFEVGSDISNSNFGDNAFPVGINNVGNNDLKAMYDKGKAGTYTRTSPYDAYWTKTP